MKQVLTLLTAGTLFFAACQSAPDADKALTAEEQAAADAAGAAYTVDVTGSNVGWIGSKVGGQHNGTFKIADGSLAVQDGNLTGGTFNIDVSSLVVDDLTGDDKASLEGHLKNGDFFLVDSFPTAKFEITAVQPFDSTTQTTKLEGATHTISGNLTLRGETKNVTFPAKVSIDGSLVTAQADFNIDRTNWGIVYKGPNNPQDWFISKEVNLKLDIKANGGTL